MYVHHDRPTNPVVKCSVALLVCLVEARGIH